MRKYQYTLMVKFSCLVCEKAVGINLEAVCVICLTDRFTFIAITLEKKHTEILKNYQTSYKSPFLV